MVLFEVSTEWRGIIWTTSLAVGSMSFYCSGYNFAAA